MVEQIALSTNKIHEEDFLTVLNHSTKGAMTDSFRREYFPQPFISRKWVKLKLLSQLERVLVKFIIKNFWKGLFETALQKQQWLARFVVHLITLLIWKLVKLKSSLVRKLSKAQLKFIIAIVQSKTEIAQTMRIVESATRIIGETVSK